MTTLADIIRDLRSHDKEPFSGQEPTIYAAEPWSPHSRAIVSWSIEKGGLPDDAARLHLVRLLEVRAALRLLADRYHSLVLEDRQEELCALLITRVQDLIQARLPEN
jgi:hypothetical protein